MFGIVKLQFIVLLENAVGNAEDSVPYGMLEKLQLCCFRCVSTLETGCFGKNASLRAQKVL